MKALCRSFLVFMRQIAGDSMLYAVMIAPLLAACFFRFGIPFLETFLCGYFAQDSVLSDYYLLFDLLLALLTPYMFCFAAAMVMLTEYDENMAVYLAVTPVGKRGYLISRLVFPALISFFVSFLLLFFFSLTSWTLWRMLLISLLTSLFSIPLALLLVAFSHNRVEGMALAKLSGLVMLGLPVPFFLFSGIQYLFSPLPSFWIAKLCVDQNYFFLFPALICTLLWIWVLYRRFERKLS